MTVRLRTARVAASGRAEAIRKVAALEKLRAVDALYDKLNSPAMGGVKVGDQFRLTTRFVMPDLWAPTVTGDLGLFVQYVGGAKHMEVLADRSDAAGWLAGVNVELVVEDVQLTVNGETGHGYLRVVSVKAIS